MPPIDALKSYAGGLSSQIIDFSHSQFLIIMTRVILMSRSAHYSASEEGSSKASRDQAGDGPIPAHGELIPPFTPSHDIPRGVIQAIQSTFSYALMLAIM